MTDENSSHPIIRTLLDLGYKDIWLVYAPRFSADWGWTILKSSKGSKWLGYDKKTVLNNLKKNNK